MYETTIIISGKIDISSFSPLNALNIKGKIEQHSLRHFSNGVISKNPIFWFWFSMAFNSFWYYRCYERKILWNFQVQKSLKVTRTKFQVIWPFAEDVQWVSVWTVLLLHVNITCIKHYEIQLKNNFEIHKSIKCVAAKTYMNQRNWLCSTFLDGKYKQCLQQVFVWLLTMFLLEGSIKCRKT